MNITISEKPKTNIKDKHMALMNELYRSFDFFNKHFCDGKLNRPIITIQKGKKNNLGHYGCKFWGDIKDKEQYFDEINFNAEALHRPPNEVLETLLHEMAHLKNWQADIKDCTETQYHTKKFKTSAESFGLKVDKMGNRGYAHTSLGEEALKAIELLEPKTEVYSITRKPTVKMKKPSKYITLQVDLSYQDKIDEILEGYKNKREMTEAAINFLYNQLNK